MHTMEFQSIVEFLEDKTILVTGATGFLAKVFLEKILRVQPNVRKLCLLLRAAYNDSATKRFQNEILSQDLFGVLEEKLGGKLNSLIFEKINIVPGDVYDEDLGVNDSNLKEKMKREIDVILNFAATTNFYERYDVAFGTDRLGAKHVLYFAKDCPKLMLLVHVSTAFIPRETSGVIMEDSYQMGETLNPDGFSCLDIHKEKKLIEEKLNERQAEGAKEGAAKGILKDMGTTRANTYGWANTYVFTKAMGEILIEQLKGDLPVVIIRPAMVTSTYKEPFPGWIEGVKTIDAIIVAYGKGKLTFLPVGLETIVDVIPADMVVNAIIMVMVAHTNRPTDLTIYHVGSSARNAVRVVNIREFMYCYFINKPWIGKDGKAVKVGKGKILGSIPSFHRYMTRYILLLKYLSPALELANTIFCKNFQGMRDELNRKVSIAMRLVDLYRPFLFFSRVFDDTNIEELRTSAKYQGIVEIDGMLFCNPRAIDWEDYFINVHISGIVKYGSK